MSSNTPTSTLEVTSATNSATFHRYGDTAYDSIMPKADRLFVSAACPNTDRDKSEIWYNCYIDGLKYGVAAIGASFGFNHLLMKKAPMYRKIDPPRRFFLWTLFSLAIFQYNLEATEVSMITKINLDTLVSDLELEKEQHRKFIEEHEKNLAAGNAAPSKLSELKKKKTE